MADEPGKSGTPDPQGATTFTQDDLNRVAAKTRSEVKAQYGDYELTKKELEDLRTEKAEREEREKTERQKEIDAAVKAHDKKLRDEFGTKERQLNLDRAIELEFMQLGKDPALRHMLFGEFAVASAEEVKEKIAALLVAKPYLNAQTMQKGIATGGSPSSPTSSAPGATVRTSRARINELRRTGTWVGSPEEKANKQGLLDVID